jgi:hypothetical protein
MCAALPSRRADDGPRSASAAVKGWHEFVIRAGTGCESQAAKPGLVPSGSEWGTPRPAPHLAQQSPGIGSGNLAAPP